MRGMYLAKRRLLGLGEGKQALSQRSNMHRRTAQLMASSLGFVLVQPGACSSCRETGQLESYQAKGKQRLQCIDKSCSLYYSSRLYC
jgi:hypothetical protein